MCCRVCRPSQRLRALMSVISLSAVAASAKRRFSLTSCGERALPWLLALLLCAVSALLPLQYNLPDRFAPHHTEHDERSLIKEMACFTSWVNCPNQAHSFGGVVHPESQGISVISCSVKPLCGFLEASSTTRPPLVWLCQSINNNPFVKHRSTLLS